MAIRFTVKRLGGAEVVVHIQGDKIYQVSTVKRDGSERTLFVPLSQVWSTEEIARAITEKVWGWELKERVVPNVKALENKDIPSSMSITTPV
jgi:hypothetical protein